MLHFTTINHAFRKANNLSNNEYVLLDMVYHLSNNQNSNYVGWCYMLKDKIAEEIGLTKRGVQKMISRLSSDGFLIVQDKTYFLKTTNKWLRNYVFIDDEISASESGENKRFRGEQNTSLGVNKVHVRGEQSSCLGVNKVHVKGEQSSPNIYIDNNNKDKYIDNIKNNQKVGVKNFDLKLPFSDPQFMMLWKNLLEEKKWRNKSQNSIELALKKLGRENLQTAVQMLEDAIEGGWQGLHKRREAFRGDRDYQNKTMGANATFKNVDYSNPL